MSSYVAQNLNLEPCKPKKQHNLYYSLLLSILLTIFILIFYVLDLSPSSVINDTRILFFISNTLLLIIVADYSAFTDKENHDFYGEYAASMKSDARENLRPEHLCFEVKLSEEIKNLEEQETLGAKDIPRYLLRKEAEVPEKTLQVVSEDKPTTKAVETSESMVKQKIHISAFNEKTCNARKKGSPRSYGRSKSDKARRQEIKHRHESYGRRSKSESSEWMVVDFKEKKADVGEEKWENVREESEEFSKMSDEELNRRVEDFIQQFNRDIRRQ